MGFKSNPKLGKRRKRTARTKTTPVSSKHVGFASSSYACAATESKCASTCVSEQWLKAISNSYHRASRQVKNFKGIQGGTAAGLNAEYASMK